MMTYLDRILDVRVGDWLHGLAPTASCDELVALRQRLERMVAPHAPRVGLDDDGTLDEFVLNHPDMIHFEAMDTNEWWIGIHRGDRWWHINCGAKNPRAKGYAHIQENP